MATNWNIIINSGAEYQASVTIDTWPATFPALSTATGWQLTLAQPGQSAFLTATTSNYITLNGAKTVGTIVIPSTVTSTLPCGSAFYDLDILFTGNVVKRVISLGLAQVNLKAGST